MVVERLNKEIVGLGIGVPGPVDIQKGLVHFLPNLPGWQKVPLKKILEKELSLPVSLDNDSNCFVLAETRFGAAQGYQNVIGLTLGTGLGGGIIINGEIYHGANGLAGEIGHMVIVAEGLKCNCGNRGCLEQYVSGSALVLKYKKLTGQEKTPLEIEKESEQKKKPALKVIEETGYYLGLGLANLINILNPEIIVLGGGVARTKTLYSPTIREMKKRVFPLGQKTPVVISKLGREAGIIGAAWLS
ncbi:MAG TPA: ROK family protein [Candidatus Portnoybacteria bacterium]|nr:ROK family protein [Candidatus Portnoybacteria bacterium]